MYFDNKYNYELITNELLNKLIKETQAKGLNWDRICLHKDSCSRMHSMVMCMNSGVESGFHYNENSEEIITYSFLGFPFKIKIMENITTKKIKTLSIDSKNPLVTLKDSICRSIINNSEKTIIYLEHRAGPYLKEKIIWIN